MNDTLVTLQGNVGGPVKLRRAGETVVASFRLGCTPRRYHRATDQWVDDETQWFTINAWRTLADHCEASLRRGDAVVVHGRLSLRTWIDANQVEQQTLDVQATHIGHDLSRGTSTFTRASRATEAPAPEAAPEAAAPDAAVVAA
ncbi:single-stranded DNA-binding protein [Nocardioides sp.]|uniref:single-stranded DNA-binding protein n=1 Tax=Nocardioides sp. TaxID=35761 RepID=UPI0035673737